MSRYVGTADEGLAIARAIRMAHGVSVNFNPYHGKGGKFASSYTAAHHEEYRALSKEGNAILKLRKSGAAEAHHHERLVQVKARKRVLEAIQRGEVEGPARGAAAAKAQKEPKAPKVPKGTHADMKGTFGIDVAVASAKDLKNASTAMSHVLDVSGDKVRAVMAADKLSYSMQGATKGANGTYRRGVETGEASIHLRPGMDSSSPAPFKGSDWGVDVSTQGTMRHEYGHHVQYSLKLTEDPRWLALYGKYKKDKKAVSTYARSSSNELFAEAFAAVTHPKYKGSDRMPKDVEAYMRDVVGIRV